jgi:hypothetical protein
MKTLWGSEIMTKKEYMERNIGITFDFIRHLIDHPEIIDTIPNGAELGFIDKEIPFKIKRQGKGKKVERYRRYRVEHIFESL